MLLKGGKVISFMQLQVEVATWFSVVQTVSPTLHPEFLLQAFEILGPEQNDRYVSEAQKDKKTPEPWRSPKLRWQMLHIYYCALVPTVTGNPSTQYKNLRGWRVHEERKKRRKKERKKERKNRKKERKKRKKKKEERKKERPHWKNHFGFPKEPQ